MRADDPDVQILRALNSEPSNYCSGEELASLLGISRVAVWKRLEKLKKTGYVLEAIRRKGYRLTAKPESQTEAGILAEISEDSPLQSLTLFDAVRSTNDEAFRMLSNGGSAPLACATKRQPGGKGRRGRSWCGETEGNIYTSLGFRPNVSPRRMSLLPIWAGLKICRRISSETGLPLGLKWPNDLMLEGKKVAGMLAESTLETDRVTSLVFGIGMNVNMSSCQIPDDLQEIATSLSIAAGKKLSLDRLTACVIEEIIDAHEDCSLGVDEDLLADEWEIFACFRNQKVCVKSDDETVYSGSMAGIDRAGSLLLRDEKGNLRSFRAGDVSLRPQVY